MTLRKKLWITVACLSVILCTLVTGTIAWLTDKTPAIENTFTPSNIKVELSESNATDNKQNFKMIPGKTYVKDPKVTVTTDIECYAFVQVEENLGAWAAEGKTFSDYFTYSVHTGANGWTLVPGTTNVYYFVASANTEKYILVGGNDAYANGQITVKGDTVTKAMMDKLAVQNAVMPTLTFTAYAIQSEYLTDANNDGVVNVADAWAAASGSN